MLELHGCWHVMTVRLHYDYLSSLRRITPPFKNKSITDALNVACFANDSK